MAHNNIDKSNAHMKAARMAYKMVKRQAVDEEESSSAAGRQPLSTASDEDELTPTLAPGRGSAISSSVESSTTRSSTTRRTTTPRESTTSTTEEDDEETSTTESSSSTRATSSSSTRLAPVRSTPSTTSAPTTTSAGRTTSSSALPSSTSRGISDTTSSNDTNSAESGSSSNAGTIAGVIIAVLAVLLIAAFFGWRFWKKKKAARAANGGLGESDTFYPFGGAGAASNGNADKGNGYNQRINSFEDLASNAAAANGYNNGNGEKYGQQNGNGYGTMGGDDHNNEKALGAMAGAAGFGAMNRQRSAEEENFAGRGLSPYNSFSSFSHLPNNGLQGLRSPTSPPMNGSPAAAYGSDSYPPTPQQQAHYSQQGSIFNNAPNASMMGHPADIAGTGYAGVGDHLPSHQDRALGNAMDSYNGNGNAIALGAAGAAIGAAALAEQQSNGQQGPFADPASEGKNYIVTRTFEPSMPDELLIYPGDRIQIVVPYDDGWCLGCNLSMAEREGVPPARGVFPRDCVEEWTPELEKMMNGVTPGEEEQQENGLPTVMEEQQRPTSVNSDIPLNSQANLQRAPTLPPLDMGDNSRFSMTSANNNNKRMSHLSNNNRPASLVPGQIPLPASIKSPVSATGIPLPADNEVEEDIYGGVSDDVTSPVNKSFAPNIQVSSNNEPNATNNKRESVSQFGSSYHIADYASRLGDDNDDTTNNVAEKRLSTLDEEDNHTNDEFPSTPRTTISNATTGPSSPRFSGVPPLSATGENNMMAGGRSPAASSARLSVAGSMINNDRLSVASAMMPSSQSVKSLKRTSSLIAPQDAETFLASPTSGEPANRIA